MPKAELSVWATRPRAQNSDWCKTLAANDINCIDAPLLAIEPLEGEAETQAIKYQILALDNYEILIFVSQNAVQYGVEWVNTYWPEWPVRQSYIAIGKKTALKLGEHVHDVLCPQGSMDTTAVLNMPQLRDVQGLRVLIFRGHGGLPVLGEQLQQRGAQVDYCELYTRVAPRLSDAQCQRVVEGLAQKNCVISIFSGETLQNLQRFMQSNNLSLTRNPVLVPGIRVAKLAAELGFTQIIQAANASEEAMLQSLLQWRTN